MSGDRLLALFSKTFPALDYWHFFKKHVRQQQYFIFIEYLRHFLLVANIQWNLKSPLFAEQQCCVLTSLNNLFSDFSFDCLISVISRDSPLYAAKDQLWIYILYFWKIISGTFFKNMSEYRLLALLSKTCPATAINT